MREAKFMAWDIRQKSMWRVSAVNDDRTVHVFRYEPNPLKDNKLDRVSNFHMDYPDQVILMQYIGLNDKHGKEIYEGYIVITDEAGWVGRVVYHRDGFVCVDEEGGFASHCNWEAFEVIGNIYKNPKLLAERR